MALLGFFSTTLCRGAGNQTHHSSRVAPDWNFWRTLYRLSYSAAAWHKPNLHWQMQGSLLSRNPSCAKEALKFPGQFLFNGTDQFFPQASFFCCLQKINFLLLILIFSLAPPWLDGDFKYLFSKQNHYWHGTDSTSTCKLVRTATRVFTQTMVSRIS